jgi:two-component system, chemotaxis family, CheB/CheR fusion protein
MAKKSVRQTRLKRGVSIPKKDKDKKGKHIRDNSKKTPGKPKRQFASSKKPTQYKSSESDSFTIVGMGASAGGLEALEKFFTHMPPDSGMAFVIVLHLDPTHESIMDSLLKKVTKMQVYQVEDGMKAQPNCVYVIPPKKDMIVMNGNLQLLDSELRRGLRRPIDFFFRSLAEDQKERAICIVLSGTGTEGTLGLKAIKGEGGLVMVQSLESAKYDGMPRSAIATDLADYILPPEDMPEQMIKYVKQFHYKLKRPAPVVIKKISNLSQKIFFMIRNQTGRDFSLYKQTVITRRIDRRMTVHQIKNLSDYVRYLQDNPMEVEKLSRELLIGATSFFRDKEAFEIMQKTVLPLLFKNKPYNQIFRVWVPACSTGEEAYSLAMLLREYMDKVKRNIKVQIFSTDLDNSAIDTARAGVYPDSISVDVTAERLHRFFSREDNSYRIIKEIRDMLIFAPQDVTKDPPFSKLDLISCRNLLIYLGSELQKRLMHLFHYSLRPNGILFLGSSETIGEMTDFFSPFDRKWKIYNHKEDISAPKVIMDFPAISLAGGMANTRKPVETTQFRKADIGELTEKILLESYTPAAVIINQKGDILYIHGRTGKYLEPAQGKASMNIMEMAHEDLRPEIGSGIRKAITEKTSTVFRDILVKTNGDTQLINLEVKPITKPEPLNGLLLVTFEEIASSKQPKMVKRADRYSKRIEQRVADLESELRTTKEHLQTTIEELETSNEELKSLNEELQSSNEELLSTNEEVETSSEELQSLNEELEMVNAELQRKIEELSGVNDDINNLLVSTEIATIFLDNELRIKRYTPAATRLMKFIETDIGRPIGDIRSNLMDHDLIKEIQGVLKTLGSLEKEVQDLNGCFYLMRILPYRTRNNVIDGITVKFVDITERKLAEKELQIVKEQKRIQEWAESITSTVREPILVLDDSLKVLSANRSFYKNFQVKPDETIGRYLYQLGNQQWDIPQLRELLEEILPQNTSFIDFKIKHDFPSLGVREMLLNARRVVDPENKATQMILLAIEDVTGKSAIRSE